MEELLLKVHRMTCHGCEERIRSAVERLPGVRSVDADHTNGHVRVTLDPGRTTSVEVHEVVERLGHEVAR